MLLPGLPGCKSGGKDKSLTHFAVAKAEKVAGTLSGFVFCFFYMGVRLVLHALHKHALDDFQVMLLLVAEDSWKVPKAEGRQTTVRHRDIRLKGRVAHATGSHQNMWRAASRRLTLSEFTESNRNLSTSGHWLFPSSSGVEDGSLM